MKNFIILFTILIIILAACENKVSRKTKEPEKDFLEVPTYAPTPDEITSDSTYWYVIMNEVKKDGGSISWHKAIALPTQYFDFYLARKAFKSATESGYFEFILKINKEARNSYWKYAADNSL
ncbi:MAG: hypothetical protein WC428_02575 [Candidatus Paceibacterota bacterium]